MNIAATRTQLDNYLQNTDRSTVGFVPTMGALHQGHLSLIKKAAEECGTVVVSIFVNPTQFNDPKDLATYPRTPEKDLDMLAGMDVDIVFMPSVEEIYPQKDERIFDLGLLDKVMEGASRPGHFNGVAQVVSRLFEIVRPAKAYFGEKDYQQIAVIREMARQLNYATQIVPCDTVRETDGLAMSSRNVLLEVEYRKAAPVIFATMTKYREQKGIMSPSEIEVAVREEIERSGKLNVIYFNLVNGATLEPITRWTDTDNIRACIAVQAGRVRLIDNISF